MPESSLPKTIDDAIASADTQNPIAIAAELREQASRHTVDRLAADRLPQVKLRGGIDGERSFSSGPEDRDSASVAVRVSVPIFDGGATTARVEQAKHVNVSLAEETRGIREKIHSSVMAAWARLTGGRERLAYEQVSVKASRQALEGVREEIRLGQRSTLEGLDAQRELVASEERLAAGERDLIVAAYALLAVTGQLTLREAQGSSKTAAAASAETKSERGKRKADAPNSSAWRPVINRTR